MFDWFRIAWIHVLIFFDSRYMPIGWHPCAHPRRRHTTLVWPAEEEMFDVELWLAGPEVVQLDYSLLLLARGRSRDHA